MGEMEQGCGQTYCRGVFTMRAGGKETAREERRRGDRK